MPSGKAPSLAASGGAGGGDDIGLGHVLSPDFSVEKGFRPIKRARADLVNHSINS
jgi:hypothetical protein